MDQVLIRKYRPEDRIRVRRIAWDTAFIGRPASAFFADRQLLEDMLTGYFTDYEPESCFVAESGSEVIGYLLGCRDSRTLDRVSLRYIVPQLLKKVIMNNTLVRSKNIIFGWHMLTSLIRGELSAPDFSAGYPATMHINIQDGFRRAGIGSRLMDAYLAYLRSHDVRGVRLATFSPDAGKFFCNRGFTLLFQKARRYFRYILKRDVNVYIYGKRW
jgi:GNAT superfamily N-acetyltransferase